MWLFALAMGALIQSAKFLLYSLAHRQLHLDAFVSSNGVPSLHAVMLASLATMIWRVQGGESAAYNAVLIFSAIVLHDAVKVKVRVEESREAAHMVAQRLQGRLADPIRWRELLLPADARRSHRPVHVAAGLLLGVLVGMSWRGSP